MQLTIFRNLITCDMSDYFTIFEIAIIDI